MLWITPLNRPDSAYLLVIPGELSGTLEGDVMTSEKALLWTVEQSLGIYVTP